MSILNKKALELQVSDWIDEGGHSREPLKLSDLGEGYKILFCFQDWCQGCHSTGFPTLQKLVKKLQNKKVGFAAIQTVFEGELKNTFNKLKENQQKYALTIPFGHDIPSIGERLPSVMIDYQTRGTPWFIIIDSQGMVVFNDFRLNADALIQHFSV